MKIFPSPVPWSVAREWDDQICFIVCGGPSVTPAMLDAIRGHKTIVINSSYMAVPLADYLVFTDSRWWRLHYRQVRTSFEGKVVTINPLPPLDTRRGIHFVLDRQRSGGLSPDPTRLVCWHTTVTSAINLAVHLGANIIGVLGLDGKDAPDGRLWHHHAHPPGWGRSPVRYQRHAEALIGLVEPLKTAGVGVYNLNPDSAHTAFSYKPLDELIAL